MKGMSLGICGLGLIGSSIARAWVGRGPVMALDPDPNALTRAAAVGVHPVKSLADLSDVDLVVLAAPTAANVGLLGELISSGSRPATMDAGSVKAPIMAAWRESDSDYPFVATHPMAGSELSGFEAGHASLFADASWPVVVADDTDARSLMLVVSVVLELGAWPTPVSESAHDRSVAEISHLPHLLSGALGRVAARSDNEELSVQMAAGSFRDVSRVSGSPPRRTAEFISANRVNAAASARMAAKSLEQAAELLLQGDETGLAEWLSVGGRIRSDFVSRGEQTTWAVPGLSDDTAKDALAGVRDSGSRVVDLTREAQGLKLTFGRHEGSGDHD
jgi:prephenate dehydrogenase